MTVSAIRQGSTLALPDRLAGAVWGHLVGDAVGVPYEFKHADEIGEVRFGATGSHGRPPGTWSDDGSLMLALLDSLLTAGLDTDDQARRAVEWYRHGAYTPDGVVFDVGGATREAILAIERGAPAEEAGPTHERASGNGSLMRILPLALVMRDATDAELVTLAHRASRVTHGTAPAQVACALYVLVARRLLEGDRVGRAAALASARATLREVYEGAGGSAEHLAALDDLEAWTGRSGRGFVTDSFWSAWDAFAGAETYRETIERAIAYGNDTDTTAAIAGGLAGIRWGIGGIPAEWLAGMRGHDVADPLVDRLIAAAGYRMSGRYPIRVDWVPLDSAPALAGVEGRLGMTFLPGKRREGIAGSHWRDLAVDVERLRTHHGADDLLLLVEDHELEAARVPDFVPVVEAAGIAVRRHPIRDMDVPADPEALQATLAEVRRLLAAGRSVVVACAGGLGRTGTVVACLLHDAGLDAQAAIALTRATRHGAIETGVQERFIREWR